MKTFNAFSIILTVLFILFGSQSAIAQSVTGIKTSNSYLFFLSMLSEHGIHRFNEKQAKAWDQHLKEIGLQGAKATDSFLYSIEKKFINSLKNYQTVSKKCSIATRSNSPVILGALLTKFDKDTLGSRSSEIIDGVQYAYLSSRWICIEESIRNLLLNESLWKEANLSYLRDFKEYFNNNYKDDVNALEAFNNLVDDKIRKLMANSYRGVVLKTYRKLGVLREKASSNESDIMNEVVVLLNDSEPFNYSKILAEIRELEK